MTPDAADVAAATPPVRAHAAARALGVRELASWCAEILVGALDLTDQDRHDARWIAGKAWTGWGDPDSWSGRGLDHWPRVWAARTLLHSWDPVATLAVEQGLADEAWRVREMCAKVVARYEVGSAAPECARCAEGDAVPRVRVESLRALGAVGEIEHAPSVLTAVHHEDPTVVRAAERALERMEARLDRPVT
ncbi:HEAT repeat domain-containing protein [Brachybacterium sacelli]|uniref:HEAT repeat protein n=1 Tax=Brachybacterium sacelli TaxID=173364 RepID=A0ABS4WWZ6_9MICO|nr:HEAT repeat domain-containing protein [Brachybacterium sacelli]MBP2380721.1 HEAT repeat protein [Brachybacterium sacelli]